MTKHPPRNVLVTFQHLINVHHYNVLCYTTFILTFRLQMEDPGILCPPRLSGGHLVTVILCPRLFAGIVTFCPVCGIFPSCFTPPLLPYCYFFHSGEKACALPKTRCHTETKCHAGDRMSQNGKMGREMRQECCHIGPNATMGQNVSSYGKKWNTKYIRTKCKPIKKIFCS